jgi:hypothetical protein
MLRVLALRFLDDICLAVMAGDLLMLRVKFRHALTFIFRRLGLRFESVFCLGWCV